MADLVSERVVAALTPGQERGRARHAGSHQLALTKTIPDQRYRPVVCAEIPVSRISNGN